MKKIVTIGKNSGIPLLGLIHIGIIDRGSNLLQARPTTVCNLRCIFCSTDAGPSSMRHGVDYVAEPCYLAETLKEAVACKDGNVLVNIDSVGEPTTYHKLTELIRMIKAIPGVKEVSMQTNGTLLTKKMITELEKAGLDKINLSVNALDPCLAKAISGAAAYDTGRVSRNAKFIAEKTRIKLWLCPVWLPGLNDDEIPKIIKFAKEIGANLGIQKYEVYKHSRKPKGAKVVNYWKFYKKLEEWEKSFNVKLRFSNKDLGFEKRPRLPAVFEKGEKVYVTVKCEGWLKGQMIGVAKGRSLAVNNCRAKPESRVRVRILENKNGIYLAETV